MNTTQKEVVDANRMLRLLADVAGRIAGGETIDKKWVIDQINSPAQAGGADRPSSQGPLLTVPEAASQLRISRWSIYDLIHRRKLLSVKIGRRRFIPSSELTHYVNSLPLHGGLLL
ncbi:helix-turn-helix domain-containing protein [Nocardia brasiliensis]|uniref:helix-turn-helix domain-containing protein n=1 Tax=Nocardia brasiliensis TaxID=37326 RepID=UPI003D8C9ED9